MAQGIPVSVGDIIEARLVQENALVNWLTVVHFRVVQNSPSAQFLTIANALHAVLNGTLGFYKTLNDVQESGINQTQCDYQLISPVRYSVYTYPGLGAGKTLDPKGSLPANVAFVIQRRGVLAGKGKTSVTHLSGFPVSSQRKGVLDDDAIAYMVGIKNTMGGVSALAGGVTVEWVIYNKRAPTLSQSIESGSVGTNSRTMRRRLVQKH